jgi:GDP-L-fucose synthase
MNTYNDSDIINIGCGKDQRISELATIVKQIVGYKGKIVWDKSKPNGMPRKQLAVQKLFALGWRPTTTLADGIALEYEWFIHNEKEIAHAKR